jgi:hypothetical protein
MTAGGLLDEAGGQAEEILKQARGAYGARRSLGNDAPIFHRDQLIRVPGCEIEVVKHHDDGAPVFVTELSDEVEDVHGVGLRGARIPSRMPRTRSDQPRA